MKPATATWLLRLYPSDWRRRYGIEFAALLEAYPPSPRTVFDVVWQAIEARLNSFDSGHSKRAALSGGIWCAWMLAVAAGMILYETVDDSTFIASMQHDLFLKGCWIGIQIGAIVEGGAIAVGGAPLAWSMIHHAFTTRRRDILLRLAFPFIAAFTLLGWVIAILVWTGGRWGASPWAVAIANPAWPSEPFRSITGSVSTALLLIVFAGSAVTITQALRRSQLPVLRLSFLFPGIKIDPLRFAACLSPAAAAGALIMLVSVVLWGLAASRNATGAFHEPLGPLGVSSSFSWLISVILFAVAAVFSARAARRLVALRSDVE
jgi:hypothetical protein